MPKIPPSTDLYTIGKGILYIGTWAGTTPPTDPSGFTDMGNCPSFETEPQITRLEHFSSRSGTRERDKYPVTERKYQITFTLDEIAAVNLAKFVSGTYSGTTIKGLMNYDKEYALKFISDNPIGSNMTWRFHKVVLTNNGALNLISEEWQQMSFTGEGLSDTANNPTTPYFSIDYSTTSSTSSTSSTTTA